MYLHGSEDPSKELFQVKMSYQQVTLGVIIPDDGPFDYEWLHLDEWLTNHGLAHINLYVERSKSDGDLTPEGLFKTGNIEELLPPAQRLVSRGADAIIWACTSGSFIGGLDYAETQIETIFIETGIPSTSTSLAMVAAANHLDIDQVDLLGAYSVEVTEIFQVFLNDSGIKVGRSKALGPVHTEESVLLPIAQELSEFIQENLDSKNPIFIPDTAINSLDLVENFERDFSRIVITANQASLWHGLKLLNEPTSYAGVGQLFYKN